MSELPAGHELNLQIAKWFGWCWGDKSVLSPTGRQYSMERERPFWWLPDYSGSIEDTWQVVDKMSQRGFTIYPLLKDAGQWMARFVTDDDPCGLPLAAGFVGYGDTAPLAICRAALEIIIGEDACES